MRKAFLQSEVAQQARTLDQDALQRLTELLCCGNQSVAEVAARIIARCCHDGGTVSICSVSHTAVMRLLWEACRVVWTDQLPGTRHIPNGGVRPFCSQEVQHAEAVHPERWRYARAGAPAPGQRDAAAGSSGGSIGRSHHGQCRCPRHYNSFT